MTRAEERRLLRRYTSPKNTAPSPWRARAVAAKLLKPVYSDGRSGRVVGYVLTPKGRREAGLPA